MEHQKEALLYEDGVAKPFCFSVKSRMVDFWMRNNNSNEKSCNRYVILAIFTITLCAVGAFYCGWQFINQMLLRSGAYAWLCDDNFTGGTVCVKQTEAVQSLFTIALTAQFTMNVVAEQSMHYFGARITAMIGGVFQVTSYMLLAFSSEALPMYSIAIFLLGASSDFLWYPSLSVIALFPSRRYIISGVIFAATTFSWWIPALLRLVQESGVDFSIVMLCFGLVVSLPLFILYGVFLPWRGYAASGITDVVEESSEVSEDVTELTMSTSAGSSRWEDGSSSEMSMGKNYSSSVDNNNNSVVSSSVVVGESVIMLSSKETQPLLLAVSELSEPFLNDLQTTAAFIGDDKKRQQLSGRPTISPLSKLLFLNDGNCNNSSGGEKMNYENKEEEEEKEEGRSSSSVAVGELMAVTVVAMDDEDNNNNIIIDNGSSSSVGSDLVGSVDDGGLVVVGSGSDSSDKEAEKLCVCQIDYVGTKRSEEEKDVLMCNALSAVPDATTTTYYYHSNYVVATAAADTAADDSGSSDKVDSGCSMASATKYCKSCRSVVVDPSAFQSENPQRIIHSQQHISATFPIHNDTATTTTASSDDSFVITQLSDNDNNPPFLNSSSKLLLHTTTTHQQTTELLTHTKKYPLLLKIRSLLNYREFYALFSLDYAIFLLFWIFCVIRFGFINIIAPNLIGQKFSLILGYVAPFSLLSALFYGFLFDFIGLYSTFYLYNSVWVAMYGIAVLQSTIGPSDILSGMVVALYPLTGGSVYSILLAFVNWNFKSIKRASVLVSCACFIAGLFSLVNQNIYAFYIDGNVQSVLLAITVVNILMYLMLVVLHMRNRATLRKLLVLKEEEVVV